ncbi:MAG: cysteine hydrolase [Opitutus sp.]|nr:cysteine hydrolase [Opitutus sp.]MCS6277017.1 cysteine hydrolase [Opitutus sp.]MCS6299935.1 cysteine hydrolase [Opitutus sp.]
MKALLLIDIQKGFDHPKWGVRNNPDAEKNAQKLLFHFRERRLPVFHIRHDSTEAESPLRPDRAGNEIKDIVQPIVGEEVIGKTVNSAFIGTSLYEKLKLLGVDKLVLAGLTTPHCISTSARMGANLGFEVIVISDATAAYEWIAHDKSNVSAEDMHFYSLAALNGEFATINNTVDIIENHGA